MMFYYRLARELGMTVRGMLSEMDSAEVATWIAYLAAEDELAKEREEQKKADKATEGEAVLKARLTQSGDMAAVRNKKKKGRRGKKGTV